GGAKPFHAGVQPRPTGPYGWSLTPPGLLANRREAIPLASGSRHRQSPPPVALCMEPDPIIPRLIDRLRGAAGTPAAHVIAEDLCEAAVDGSLETGVRLPTARQL